MIPPPPPPLKKPNLVGNIKLSRRTVFDRIKDIADDIKSSLKFYLSEFVLYSLSIDETTDMSNTAQMAIFIHAITSKFNIREESLALKSLEQLEVKIYFKWSTQTC